MSAALRKTAALQKSTQSGFTLIELMIAIVILAVLLGIAIPSYNQWVVESNRTEGKVLLTQAAQQLERCFTRYSAYDDGRCDEVRNELDGVKSENQKYELELTTVAATEFELTTKPLGSQTKDAECKNFTLDHTGERGVSGPGGVEECW